MEWTEGGMNVESKGTSTVIPSGWMPAMPENKFLSDSNILNTCRTR